MKQLVLAILLVLLYALPSVAHDSWCQYPIPAVIDATDGYVKFCTPTDWVPDDGSPESPQKHISEGGPPISCDLIIRSDPATRFSGLEPGKEVTSQYFPNEFGLQPCLIACFTDEDGTSWVNGDITSWGGNPWIGQCRFQDTTYHLGVPGRPTVVPGG